MKRIKKDGRNLGFTIVELLVTVSIVAILAAVGVSVFSGAQKNGRDQQRLRDLNTFKQSLELYRSEAHYYPASWDLVAGSPLTFNGTVYLDTQNIPKDPGKNDSVRRYVYAAQPSGCNNTVNFCTGFVLCAKQEGSTSYSPPAACNVSCGASQCDMGVPSP